MWPDFLLRGINFDSGQAKKKDVLPDVFFGACGRIRTGDLLITSELLCQLSHTSTVKYQMIV